MFLEINFEVPIHQATSHQATDSRYQLNLFFTVLLTMIPKLFYIMKWHLVFHLSFIVNKNTVSWLSRFPSTSMLFTMILLKF